MYYRESDEYRKLTEADLLKEIGSLDEFLTWENSEKVADLVCRYPYLAKIRYDDRVRKAMRDFTVLNIDE